MFDEWRFLNRHYNSAKHQRRRYLPPFRRQNVVSPACGLQIHHLQPDARRGEGAHEGAGGEAQAVAGAEQHDLGAEAEELGHVGFGEGFRGGDGPVGEKGFRQDDDVAFVTLLVDGDVAFAVGGEDVEAGGVGEVQLHGRLDLGVGCGLGAFSRKIAVHHAFQ